MHSCIDKFFRIHEEHDNSLFIEIDGNVVRLYEGEKGEEFCIRNRRSWLNLTNVSEEDIQKIKDYAELKNKTGTKIIFTINGDKKEKIFYA